MKLPFNLKDIKPGAFSYLTKRRLEENGEIILWKETGKGESNYVMRCPYCAEEQQGSVILEKRPYRVQCSKCGKSISLQKLLDQAKRERKKEMEA